jgi:hypothetical protein
MLVANRPIGRTMQKGTRLLKFQGNPMEVIKPTRIMTRSWLHRCFPTTFSIPVHRYGKVPFSLLNGIGLAGKVYKVEDAERLANPLALHMVYLVHEREGNHALRGCWFTVNLANNKKATLFVWQGREWDVGTLSDIIPCDRPLSWIERRKVLGTIPAIPENELKKFQCSSFIVFEKLPKKWRSPFAQVVKVPKGAYLMKQFIYDSKRQYFVYGGTMPESWN